MAPKRTNTLTGFVTRVTPPTLFTTRQANRMLLIRSPQIADIRRNLKQEKCRVDWLVSQESEILICFPNRQEFVNYCSTHAPHLFGPNANFYIPPPATQPAPWILNFNKNITIDKGLLSDSDLDSDSEQTNHKSAQTKKLKNKKYDIATLFDSNIDTDTEITIPISEISAERPPTSNTKTTEQIPHTNQMTTPNQISQTTHITQNTDTISQNNTALQIHHHTNKCNNPFYIKTLASQLQIHNPKHSGQKKIKSPHSSSQSRIKHLQRTNTRKHLWQSGKILHTQQTKHKYIHTSDP